MIHVITGTAHLQVVDENMPTSRRIKEQRPSGESLARCENMPTSIKEGPPSGESLAQC